MSDLDDFLALLDETATAPNVTAPSLKDCIDYLAGVCNYARTQDGHGFNKFDTERGHLLAHKDYERWSEWEREWAFKKIHYYQRQLVEAGIHYELVPAPDKPKRPEPIKRIVRLPNSFGIQFSGLDHREYDAVRTAIAYGNMSAQAVYWRGDQVPEDHRDRGPLPFVVPLDSVAARNLREFANAHGFELGAGVEQEFYQLVDKAAVVRAMADAVDAPDYELGVAEISDPEPWGHQRSFVRYAEQVGWKVLLADEPGTGKTISAILAALKSGHKGWLVLCPNQVKRQWAGVLRRVAPHLSVGVMNGGGVQRVSYDVVIANYDIVRMVRDPITDEPEPSDLTTLLALRPFEVLIIDEGHKLKNEGAMRTRAAQFLAEQHDFPVRIGLTGTPILNRVDEFIPQLEILGLMGHFGTKAQFKRWFGYGRANKELYEKLCEAGYMSRTTDHHVIDPNGRFMELRRVSQWVLPPELIEAEAAEQEDAARRELTSQIRERLEMHRYKFLEGALRLKGRVPSPAPVDLDDWAAYAKEHNETVEWLRQMASEIGDDAAFARWLRAIALVRINKLRQKIAHRKMREGLPYIEELLATGDKAVVVVWHTDIGEKVLRHFPGAAVIRGGQSARERDEEKWRFMHDDDCKLLVMNILAGGEGLDGLQTSCHNVVFMEYPWNPGTLDQAERRLYRGGQKRAVVCHYVVANPEVMPTIDQYMLEVIDKKKGTVTSAMHGADAPDDAMLLTVVRNMMAGTPSLPAQELQEAIA